MIMKKVKKNYFKQLIKAKMLMINGNISAYITQLNKVSELQLQLIQKN
jgi:hypothetical protein